MIQTKTAKRAGTTSTDEPKYWNLSADAVIDLVNTDKERGLGGDEAAARLAANGRNRIEVEKQTSKLAILMRQFYSPLIIILIAASIITAFIGHVRDSVFILVAVVVNALLGFYQENKAEQALSELETYLKQRSRVIRNGIEKVIDSEELVVGDIVRLSQGDRVPADARIIYANDLQAEEAVLTGESMPVVKVVAPSPEAAVLADQESMVFAGTLVTQGVATVVVCRTGKATEFGQIAELIASSENEVTPLQKAIQKFSIFSSLILGALTVVVFIIGLAVGHPPIEMFLTAVAIAVSAIPEGLPVALTVILSVGVQRMARRKGVVRKLIAAEALGSTTLILTDKTGTLTMARMELTDIVPLGDLDQNTIVRRGLLNASVIIENPDDKPDAWRMTGKIMENALVKGAALRGVPYGKDADLEVIQSVPFNAVHKYSVSLVRLASGKHVLVFFGAPDILLAHSTFDTDRQHEIGARIDRLASAGNRVLGVAHKDIEPGKDYSLAKDLDFSSISLDGLIEFHDPVRPNVKHAIKMVGKAGIRTVIMTGDHKGTAQAIAREVGLDVPDSAVLDASELANLSEDELKARLPQLQVISRVTPFDKLRIAKLYQSAGEIVAMTGDGVNDAPSIKQANVGIAMGSGTEVSRSVADLVLLDDNFETIVAAVEEGRQIMANIRKALVYLFSNVADGLILIGGSLLAGISLPLSALQILWVNFFSDSFPATAFAFEKDKHALSMKRNASQGLFDPLMRFLVLFIGLTTSTLLFFLYWYLMRLDIDEKLVKTFIFASFGTYTLFVALPVRSLERSIFSYPLFSNPLLMLGIGIGVILMLAAVYVPFLQTLFDTVALPWPWALGVAAVSIANIACIEFGKWLFRLGK